MFTGQIPKTARLTDFGVVPVFGCAVKVSVAEVVTNAWLVRLLSTICNLE